MIYCWGSSNSGWGAKYQTLSGFVNNVLLEHKHTMCYYIVYGCFWATIAYLNIFNGDCMAHRALNV